MAAVGRVVGGTEAVIFAPALAPAVAPANENTVGNISPLHAAKEGALLNGLALAFVHRKKINDV